MQQQRNEANDMFQRIANEVADQVSKKNHDYGNSYFRLRKEWGVQSFGVRLGDKYHKGGVKNDKDNKHNSTPYSISKCKWGCF